MENYCLTNQIGVNLATGAETVLFNENVSDMVRGPLATLSGCLNGVTSFLQFSDQPRKIRLKNFGRWEEQLRFHPENFCDDHEFVIVDRAVLTLDFRNDDAAEVE